MFDKAMTKSIQAYLQPGEELLNATIVQGKGLAKMMLAGGVIGVRPAGRGCSSRVRNARTSDRRALSRV